MTDRQPVPPSLSGPSPWRKAVEPPTWEELSLLIAVLDILVTAPGGVLDRDDLRPSAAETITRFMSWRSDLRTTGVLP